MVDIDTKEALFNEHTDCHSLLYLLWGFGKRHLYMRICYFYESLVGGRWELFQGTVFRFDGR